MIDYSKVGVIGGGSWATAIVKMLCNKIDVVNWWMRNERAVEHLKLYNRNPNYLSSVYFPEDKVNISTDLHEIIDASDVIIIATPSAFLYDLFEGKEFKGIENKVLISAVKGIVPEYHAIPARYIHKQFGVPYDKIAIISGPCHAEEVAMEKLSYLTFACKDLKTGQEIANLFESRYIQTTTSDDIFGTELSAILKNIYALAAGIFHGLGYGDNFQAVLVSNAIQEIERFVDKVHPIHRDVKSSGYLGDLLVTAYSQFSRNRTFGNMIGKGVSVKTTMMEMNMVAEGYYAVKSVMKINEKFQVDLPITEAVYRILYEKVSPFLEMSLLAKKLS